MADTPILLDKPFPEVQVRSPYTQYSNKIMGSVLVTGGVIEHFAQFRVIADDKSLPKITHLRYIHIKENQKC